MRRRRAFTLPEVLATLMLVGLVLPVVMQGISLALRAAEDAGKRGEAASLAETKLQEFVLLGDAERLMSGDFGPDFPGFSWTREEAAVEDSMIETTVHVNWTTRGRPMSLAMTTWRAPTRTATGTMETQSATSEASR